MRDAGNGTGPPAKAGTDRGELDHLFGRPFGRRPAEAPGANASVGRLILEFQDAAREAQAIAVGLTDQEFNWRPAAGRWSVGECLAHLNIVGSEMLPVMDAATAEARRRGWHTAGPFRIGLLARWWRRGFEPPVRRRRNAADHHVPPSDQRAREGLAALLDLFGQLTARLQEAGGLDLSRPRVAPPVASVFRVNIYEALVLFAAHARRHLAQAREIRERSDFGRGGGVRPAAPARRTR